MSIALKILFAFSLNVWCFYFLVLNRTGFDKSRTYKGITFWHWFPNEKFILADWWEFTILSKDRFLVYVDYFTNFFFR